MVKCGIIMLMEDALLTEKFKGEKRIWRSPLKFVPDVVVTIVSVRIHYKKTLVTVVDEYGNRDVVEMGCLDVIE